MLYIDNIPQALLDSWTYLYGDDNNIFYQRKYVTEIENISSEEFTNVSKCFIDNRLEIHFSGDKTKCILFSKEKIVTYNYNRIKQFHIVE